MVAAESRVTTIATLYTGNTIRQLSPKARAAITGISGPESEPIALTNCASDRFREYFPSSETSRISGFPATCNVVAPAPNSRTVSKNTGNVEKPATAGMSRPASMMHNPRIRTNFLPFLS